MADRYRLPAGAQSNRDYLATVDEARGWLEETWAAHPPWTAGSWTSRAVETHLALQSAGGCSGTGSQPQDAVIHFVQQWLEARQDRATGAWYAGVDAPRHNVVNGIFKLFVTYERLGWEIPRQRAIIDFVLGGGDRERGFGGRGCSVFDPMQVLYVLRCRGNGYRAAEVDAVTAATFLTFLDNWDDAAGWFREGTWHGKHNLGIPLYMASLLLDHPYMRINTIYNWREGPIILRAPDGGVRLRPASSTTLADTRSPADVAWVALTAASPVRWSSFHVHDRKNANAITVRIVDDRVWEPPHEPPTNPSSHHATRVAERED